MKKVDAEEGYVFRFASLVFEELRTEEKDGVNGEGEDVLCRRPEPKESIDEEPRLVDRGVRPRRALVPGAGSPQADGCPLTACAPGPELLLGLEAVEFCAAGKDVI